MTFSVTYSAEDDRLRLSSSLRLDSETYARVKAAGFSWAPKQDVFFAAWTPEREDLALELAGQIDDEDSTLMARAEDRAERFEGYQERRLREAESAREAVEQVSKRFEGGQPIILAHHSTKKALKDKERMENGMRRAVNLWKTSEYWKDRAAAALRHAKYKELPAVRHRRIRTLKAEHRKWGREKAEAAMWLSLWNRIDDPESIKRWGEQVTKVERARYVANRCHLNVARDEESRLTFSAWDVLRPDDERHSKCPSMTPEQLQEIARRVYPARIAYCDRWLLHLDNRLVYERALLDEQGYKPPAKPKTKATLPILNYGGVISYRNPYQDKDVVGEAVGITKAEWAAINVDYKGTRVSACGTHRVRTTMMAPGHRHQLVAVYLTDSKQHPRPSDEQKANAAAARERSMEERLRHLEALEASALARREAGPDPQAEAFRALEEQARTGVQVVVAPQLFPTPPDLAARMVEMAEIEPGHRVLEPECGTGNLVMAIFAATSHRNTPPVEVVAIEINPAVAKICSTREKPIGIGGCRLEMRCEDFLESTPDLLGTFDRVLANPPFENGADIRHIRHAREFLRPGGVLVALCANGPRQREALRPLAEFWEDLPPGSFKDAGTNVNVALLVIRREPTRKVAP